MHSELEMTVFVHCKDADMLCLMVQCSMSATSVSVH